LSSFSPWPSSMAAALAPPGRRQRWTTCEVPWAGTTSSQNSARLRSVTTRRRHAATHTTCPRWPRSRRGSRWPTRQRQGTRPTPPLRRTRPRRACGHAWSCTRRRAGAGVVGVVRTWPRGGTAGRGR
ncbi:hypothetical protein BAE44_0022894, partial [Dichanthelium oligosanthes]